MNEQDRAANNSSYAQRIAKFGTERSVLSTGTLQKEMERYDRITSIGILDSDRTSNMKIMPFYLHINL